LQAVGIIDAYVSIYRVYDEYKDRNNRFCFADIIAASEPLCMFDDAWLPLASREHEQHSCVIGFNQPRNILLTGPNGSGKSYFLKLVGGLAVLAQSWTIVPAASCSMSLFADICTSFNPPEDIARCVSTFMAQKERLDALAKLAACDSPNGCCMLLVDEPYRGTIEAEAEQRCYQWCNDIAQYPHCMQLVACHLKKPLELAQNNYFALKQLEVLVHDDCTFTRTFKLKDGAPAWWFDDIPKRMAFVDSL
jgi:DNA mismatch repair ATPase MutS